MISSTQLKPEHMRALEFLQKVLETSKPIPNSLLSEDILDEGKVMIFEKPISTKSIPSGTTWRWNQTKGKKEAKTIIASREASVRLVKLIPRRRDIKCRTSIPTLKLWHYSVTFSSNEQIFVLWCEKGNSQPQLTNKDLIESECDTSCSFKSDNTQTSTNTEKSKLYATKLDFICN